MPSLRRSGLRPAALLVAAVIALQGCALAPPQPPKSDLATGAWADVDIHVRTTDVWSGRTAERSEHFVAVCNRAVGMDFSGDCSDLLWSLTKQPRGNGKTDTTVGHSWLVLSGPRGTVECGQTGEYGVEAPRYHEGVAQRIREGHPDPISYMWEDLPDGHMQYGNGGHSPQVVARFWLTEEEYDRLWDFLVDYDCDVFSLTRNQCTTLVTAALREIGVDLGHEVSLSLPPETRMLGRRIPMWRDPRWRHITFGTPDVLECSLVRAQRRGICEDALEWYRSRPRSER